MKKTLPTWAFGVLAVVGAVLVGSMVLNWIDAAGFEMRGIGLAWEDNHWLFLVPIAGAALAVAAATRSEYTRLAAIGAGIAVTGYVLLGVARGMLSSGVDTWLMLGGAGVILGGASKERAMWRVAGGAMVLAGFFAPWADLSLFRLLTSGFLGSDFTFRVLWLVPVAGVAAVISAGNKVTGAKLAAGAGIAVYGSFLWVIGSVAWAVFGIGAWIALGASTVALVIGVLARGPAELPAAGDKTPAKA